MRNNQPHCRPLAEAGPTPMIVLAGLPKSVANAAAGTVKKKFGWEAIAVPFEENGTLYATDRPLKALMRQVCEFAKKKNMRDTSPIPAPSRIALAYVKDGAWSNLLSAFGYSVAAGPLITDRDQWTNGRHWRYQIEHVIDAVEAFITGLKETHLRSIRRRLEEPSSSEPLLLPARNFMVTKHDALSSLFDAFLEDPTSLTDIDKIKPEQFTRDRLPTYYSKVGGRDKKYQVDCRKLVFPFSNNGNHAPLRENDFSESMTIAEFRRILETAYRFGSPLKAGFQHDVQFEKDKHLKNQIFECAEKGSIPISGSHANIYPNDTVR